MPDSEIAKLSDDEKSQRLKIHDALEEKKFASTDVVDEFVENVKGSLLFRLSWDEVLSAAPLSINLIGACYIACSVSSATAVTLPVRTSEPYKYLPNTSLRSCMIAMGDMGLNAFQKMGPRMSHIELLSKKINKLVNDVVKSLQGGEGAAQFLKITLANLKKMSKECSNKAAEVDKDFAVWLAYIQELHAATLAGETDVDVKRAANETQLLAAQAQQAANQKTVDAAQEAMETLRETVVTAREAYKKASDESPKGWEVVGQQFVAGLGQTINNALNACIPALVATLNPVAQVGQAVDIFKSSKDQSGKATGSEEDVSAKGTPPQQPQVLPADYNDPAYAAVGAVADVSTVLLAMLTAGKDGGVDWSTARPKPGESKQGAGYVLSMLEFSQGQFKSSNRPPSQKFSTALTQILKVAKELKQAADGQSKMGAKEPDMKTIESWQTTAQNSVNDFTILKSTADTLSKSTPPMINPSELAKSSAASSSIATAILDKAAERRTQTSTTMVQTSKDYQKAAEVYTEIGKVQAQIAAELAKLADEKISLKEIKAILTKCIESLVQLKAQVRKLVDFFSALADIIEYVEGNEVKIFTDYVEGITPQDQHSFAGFTLIDITRQAILNSAVLVRAYFSLFADIAQMLVEISAKHLEPGTLLLDKLGQEVQQSQPSSQDKPADPGVLKSVNDLKKWTATTMSEVHDKAKMKQEELLSGMNKRAEDAAQTMAQLPAVSKGKQQAIEAGKQIVADAATKGLEDYKPPVSARTFSQTSNLMVNQPPPWN